MKQTSTRRPVAWLAVLLASAPAIASAAYRCDAPQRNFDRTACEKAREGPDALRRYVQRMQVIENLDFYEYVNEAQRGAWDRGPSLRLAKRAAASPSER